MPSAGLTPMQAALRAAMLRNGINVDALGKKPAPPTLGKRLGDIVSREWKETGLPQRAREGVNAVRDLALTTNELGRDLVRGDFAKAMKSPIVENSPLGIPLTASRATHDLARGNYGSALKNAVSTGLNFLGPEVAVPAKAMFLGVMAKNANMGALKRAEKMTAAGANRDDVWKATGWGKGPDGKWRFEVDDSNSGFRRDLLQTEHHQGRRYEVGRLEDALEHPEFHKAYPDAGQMDVANYSFSNGGTAGSYHPQGSLMPAQIAMWDDGGRSTLTHEAQHHVQEAEGFARGGNAKAIGELPVNPAWKKWNDNKPLVDRGAALMKSPEYKVANDYNNSLWVSKYAPQLDALEKQYVRGQDNTFAQSQIDQLFKSADAEVRAMYPIVGELDDIAKQVPLREPPRTLTANQAYRNLAGEVEARNVQKRLDWTPEQRRATPPWATQDVPDEDQIVRFGEILKRSLP